MNKYEVNKNIFLEARLVFEAKPGEAPKAPVLSKSDAEIAKKALEDGKNAALRQKALDDAKKKAGPLPGAAPEAQKIPEIPDKLKGLKFDQKDAKIDPKTGLYEQPFKFGDFNIPGRISFPSKPEAGKPTTYLFNYVDDPGKFDQEKFLKELAKRKDQLGNTVIITLKTPQGDGQIDKKKVDTMTTLVGDLEKFQQDLAKKDPKAAGIKLPRAAHILHMTQSDDGQIAKVQTLLSKYAEASGKNDPRVLEVSKILANEPENFVDSLDRALNPPASTDTPQPTPGAPSGSSKPAPKGGGGGGAGSSGGGAASGGGGSSSPETVSSPSATPTSTPGSSAEGKEAISENVNKLLVLGDSLMVGAQDKIKANSIEKTAIVGKTLSTILKEVQNMDSSKKLENYRNESLVMDGGVNDLAAGKTDEQIMKDLKEIWSIAKKYNIKVFTCTLSPFKGAKGWNNCLEKGFEEKEKMRNSINDQIIALAGTSEGPYKIIPLHKKISEGGIADDNDPSALAPSIAAGDKLHLTPDGYTKMAKAIQEVIGQPKSKTSSGGTTETGKNKAPDVSSGEKLVPHDEKTQEFYDWASQINKEFIKNETAYGTYKVVERNGQKLLAKHTEHDVQAATGKTGKFPATEIYEYNPKFDPNQPSLLETESAKRVEKLELENRQVNAIIDYPPNFDPKKPTEIIFFATPDGSDSGKSYGEGSKLKKQVDALRSQSPKYKDKNLILVVAAPNTTKWATFDLKSPDRCKPILETLTQKIKNKYGIQSVDISVDAHSGGGFFMMNLIEKSNSISSSVHSLDFYDSLYWYKSETHAKKIMDWLKSDPQNRLNLISATPKVFAQQAQLIKDLETNGIVLQESSANPNYTELTGLNGQIRILSLKEPSHGGTIEWMGMAALKDPKTFDINKSA